MIITLSPLTHQLCAAVTSSGLSPKNTQRLGGLIDEEGADNNCLQLRYNLSPSYMYYHFDFTKSKPLQAMSPVQLHGRRKETLRHCIHAVCGRDHVAKKVVQAHFLQYLVHCGPIKGRN